MKYEWIKRIIYLLWLKIPEKEDNELAEWYRKKRRDKAKKDFANT